MATEINPLGDIYIFGYYLPATKTEKARYYITIKRLLGRTRQTVATSQIIEDDRSTMSKSAMKLAAAAKLVPAYKSSDPWEFWAKHKGLKNHVVFDTWLYTKSRFVKSHQAEGKITKI